MKSDHSARRLIDGSKLVFWDFDGVIKDSVGVKTSAFEKLFLPYGEKIALKVKKHHEANGGVSRFEKIPLYLKWAGQDVTGELVEKFSNFFSEAVFQSVVESPWVPDVHEYLLNNYKKKIFFLVTATPQEEIEEILAALKIDHCFQDVFGSPTKKEDAIRAVLEKQKIMPDHALMVGDSETDILAAEINRVPFLLRRTDINRTLQENHTGISFSDLT